MNRDDLVVEVRDFNLVRQGAIKGSDLDLEIAPIANGQGTWKLTLRKDHSLYETLATPGAGIVVTQVSTGEVIGSGPVTSRKDSQSIDSPKSSAEFSGITDDYILFDRLAYPNPVSDLMEDQADVEGDARTGDTISVLQAYVDANVGPSAPESRRNPHLFIAQTISIGDSISKSARFDNLGEFTSAIATAGNVCARVVQRGSRLAYEAYPVADRSGDIRFDVNNNTVMSTEVSVSAPTATHVITGLAELDDDRLFSVVTTRQSEFASDLWHRRVERFVNQQQTEDLDESTQAALEVLAAEGLTSTAGKVTPVDDSSMLYGRDYRLGDRIGVVIDSVEYVAPIVGIVFKANADGVRLGLVVGDIEKALSNTLKMASKTSIRGGVTSAVQAATIAAADARATAKAAAAEAAATAVADAAQATADVKTTTFSQSGVPTSLAIGDEWVDVDDQNKRYIATSVGADAVTAGEWEEVPTRILSTADTGERIVIRNDGSGGVIESYTGTTGETPGRIDPNIGGQSAPTLTITPGKDPDNPRRPQLEMSATPGSSSDGGGAVQMFADDIALAASTVTLHVGTAGIQAVGVLSLLGALEVVGHATFTGTGWLRPGATGGPTWGTGWGDNDSTLYERVAMKRVGNTVKVRGSGKRSSGSSTTIIMLPSGCWPNRNLLRPARVGSGAGDLFVDSSSGAVILSTGTYTNGDPVGFEFEFDLDQP